MNDEVSNALKDLKEVGNALKASYPDAVDYRKTDGYKTFYEDLNKLLRGEKLNDEMTFLYDRQALEGHLLYFNKDDKGNNQDTVFFERSYGSLHDVSVVTPTRYVDVCSRFVSSLEDKEHRIRVVEEVPNGGVIMVEFEQRTGGNMRGSICSSSFSDLYKYRQEHYPSPHPGYFWCMGRYILPYKYSFHSEDLGRGLSKEELDQFVANLSNMKLSEIYEIVSRQQLAEMQFETQDQDQESGFKM